MILLTPYEEVLLSYFCGLTTVGDGFHVDATQALQDLKDIGVISGFRFYKIRRALLDKGAIRSLGNMIFAVNKRPEECKTIIDYTKRPIDGIWRIYDDDQPRGKTKNLISLRSGSL